MKTFSRLTRALLVLIFSSVAFGDDFKSVTIPSNTPLPTIRVHNGQFMLIRNFTQEGGTDRGVVTVTNLATGDVAKVLTAAILNSMSSTVEVINNVVIAGPANVDITCGMDATGNCFVSYKKDNN